MKRRCETARAGTDVGPGVARDQMATADSGEELRGRGMPAGGELHHSPRGTEAKALETKGKPGRYGELDVARFAAALVVLLFHYVFRASAADGYTELVFPVLGPLAKYGYLGVDFFFMISGFVILLSVGGGKTVSGERAGRKGAARFIRSRILRLYPAYWIGCVVSFTVLALWGAGLFPVTSGDFLVNLTMLQEFVGVRHVDTVYWSLIVELKFYLLTCGVVLLGLLPRVRGLLLAWLAVSLFQVHATSIPYLGWFLFPEWSSYFIAGCAFCLIRRNGADAFLLLLVGTCCYLSIFQALEMQTRLVEHYGTEFSTLVIVATILAFYALFLFFSMRRENWSTAPSWVVALGAMTYPLYLLHQRVGYILINWLDDWMPRHAVLAVVVSLALAASWVVAHWGEPLIRSGLRRALDGVEACWGRRPAFLRLPGAAAPPSSPRENPADAAREKEPVG